MVSKSLIASALVAAAGTAASAGVFSWSAGNGSWGDHANWFGPAGQVPHLTADSASVGVQHADVLIESPIALGSLVVNNQANVFTHTGSLFVNGDVLLDDGDLIVSDGPATRDFDADTVTVRDSFLVMAGGTAQIDEALNLETASVLGVGVIEMNGAGDLDLGPGTLWADDHPAGDTLTVRRTGSSTAELDWSHPQSNVIAWENSTLDIQIPVSGALGGELYVYDESRVRVADPVIAGVGSRIILWGGLSQDDAQAVLEAPVVDSYGEVSVSNRDSVIEAPLVALRGTGVIGEEAELLLDSTAVLFDSFSMTTSGGTGGSVAFAGSPTVSVIGGTTAIDTGADGVFDLDGQGSATISIADGSALELEVGRIEPSGNERFDGTLNIDGSFHLGAYQGALTWMNRGEINLDGGEITGRVLENEGTITGSGTIEKLDSADTGEIVADGGTLVIEFAEHGHLRGTVRAETGDLSVDTTGNYDMIQVMGAVSVGDGQGIAEVFETDNTLSVGGAGSLSMNAGFVRAKNVSIHSVFATQGGSILNVVGNGFFDHGVNFFGSGTSTVSGMLEINGGGRIYNGHTFVGEGTVRASRVSEDFDFGDGADMGDVSFAAAGTVTFNDHNSGIGQATVAGFELEPTATLKVDLGGPNAGTDHDAIAAMDPAVVAGTIEVGTANGYEPAMGQTVTVLTAPSVSGSFSAVDDSGLGWERRAVVSVESDRVDVMVTCAADLNADGIVDLSDVTLFTQAFTGNDMLADLYTPEGLLDLADVLAFIELVNNGCN